MFSMVVTENGKPVQYALDNLRLPGGVLAHAVEGGKLCRRLAAMGLDVTAGFVACLQPALESAGGRGVTKPNRCRKRHRCARAARKQWLPTPASSRRIAADMY